MIDDAAGITALDEWLDANADALYKEQPLGQDWARIAKIGEEYGEAVQAFIGCTGQNPRKGYTHTMGDVTDELVDTLITCVLAIQHFTKDAAETAAIINTRWDYRKRKAVTRHPEVPQGAVAVQQDGLNDDVTETERTAI